MTTNAKHEHLMNGALYWAPANQASDTAAFPYNTVTLAHVYLAIGQWKRVATNQVRPKPVLAVRALQWSGLVVSNHPHWPPPRHVVHIADTHLWRLS
jgi:hypothetical protein